MGSKKALEICSRKGMLNLLHMMIKCKKGIINDKLAYSEEDPGTFVADAGSPHA